MQILFHGTSLKCWENIKKNGLKSYLSIANRELVSGAYLTDTEAVARDYAESRAAGDKSEPVVIEVSAPDFGFQENGTLAPPFFEDDFHRDTMQSKAWYLDAEIPPENLCLYLVN